MLFSALRLCFIVILQILALCGPDILNLQLHEVTLEDIVFNGVGDVE